jgi:Flp pilus assembly protein TadG
MCLSAKRFWHDQKGVTAIEFSLIALPLFLAIFAIVELSVQYFVSASLDHALQSAARQIRTGQAQNKSMDHATFKAEVCSQMGNLFGCESKIKLKVDVLSNVSTGIRSDPIDGSGSIKVGESFDYGKNGDFLLAQAFLPWPAFIGQFTLGRKTTDNYYVLRSIALFRNEPF